MNIYFSKPIEKGVVPLLNNLEHENMFILMLVNRFNIFIYCILFFFVFRQMSKNCYTQISGSMCLIIMAFPTDTAELLKTDYCHYTVHQ